MAVHLGHLKFVFKVRHGAQAADEGHGAALFGEIDSQAFQSRDFGVGDGFEMGLEESQAFFHGEERFLGFVGRHGHEDFVEQAAGTTEDVEVSVSNGVKGAGVDGEFHAEGVAFPKGLALDGAACLNSSVRAGDASRFAARSARAFHPVNWPNIITLSRVPALFVVVILLFVKLPWAATAAFVVFVIGGISDWLDGYLARRFKIVSNFGKLMDALTDKVLVVGLMIAMLVVPMPGEPEPLLPNWTVFLVLLIFGREFLVTGLRLVAASQGRVLAAEKTGKIKTVLQLVSVAVLLLAHAMAVDFPSDPKSLLVQIIGLWLFIGAAVLTVLSGAGYLVKYWDIFMGHPSGDPDQS